MQALWHRHEPYPVHEPELDAVPEVGPLSRSEAISHHWLLSQRDDSSRRAILILMGGFRSLGIRPIISRVITEPTAPTRRRIKKRHLIEFIKFGVVGGSGFLVNIIVAIIMNKANGGTEHAQDILFNLAGTRWNFRFTSLVWLVGFVVANITNFQLNRSWDVQARIPSGMVA